LIYLCYNQTLMLIKGGNITSFYDILYIHTSLLLVYDDIATDLFASLIDVIGKEMVGWFYIAIGMLHNAAVSISDF
ncbi:hypothetical protein ACJX0J_033277, partial [Zea mays]